MLVNCVCASVVDTDMTRNFWLNTKEKRQITASKHPLGRIGTGGDVAKAVLYFASDDSSSTGKIAPVVQDESMNHHLQNIIQL
jgi:NAD(P)-dependent dehydrogenase (short-subunit alcohol dehydrogenase family)